MSDKTSIEWTDATWNPVRGCSRVSPGCTNCYAERVAARFSGGPKVDGGQVIIREAGPFAGFATQGPPRWTGKVALVEEHLLDPLRWRKPRRIFVNSMSDLFHESLPDEEIDKVFAVMCLAHEHTFQILTKRAERMRAYFERLRTYESIHGGEGPLSAIHDAICDHGHIVPRGWKSEEAVPDVGRLWPLPNVWLGVSAEDQPRADERIPLLLQTPAAVRFVSAEPLLGPIDFTKMGRAMGENLSALEEIIWHDAERPRLDWVIAGGESGPGARPCNIAWVRAIVAQCRAAGVACFVKQLGAASFDDERSVVGAAVPLGPQLGYSKLRDRKGGDPAEWPRDMRVRDFPRVA